MESASDSVSDVVCSGTEVGFMDGLATSFLCECSCSASVATALSMIPSISGDAVARSRVSGIVVFPEKVLGVALLV